MLPFGMQKAINAANNSWHPRARVGAAIVKGGRVLSVGWNTDEKRDKNSWYWDFHAEHHAIKAYCGRFIPPGCKIYVARIKKDGTLSMALPCKKCRELLKMAGIKKVYYTDWNGIIQKFIIADTTYNISKPRDEVYGKVNYQC